MKKMAGLGLMVLLVTLPLVAQADQAPVVQLVDVLLKKAADDRAGEGGAVAWKPWNGSKTT